MLQLRSLLTLYLSDSYSTIITATITSMRRLERRVAQGEAPSEAEMVISHSVASIKRTPKHIVSSATADDRRVDVLIPIIRIAICRIIASPT